MSTHHPNRALSVQELEKRRKRAGRHFDKGKTAYFVAQHFAVSSTTAREWRERWKTGTLDAMPQGRVSLLSDTQKKAVTRSILKGPVAAGYGTELWTLGRLTALITKEHKVRYQPRSVWHLMQELGFSCQKPTRRARERDEKAITTWIQTEWPQLRKRGPHRMSPSVSSTNRGTPSVR